jgi:hypothetical protein
VEKSATCSGTGKYFGYFTSRMERDLSEIICIKIPVKTQKHVLEKLKFIVALGPLLSN